MFVKSFADTKTWAARRAGSFSRRGRYEEFEICVMARNPYWKEPSFSEVRSYSEVATRRQRPTKYIRGRSLNVSTWLSVWGTDNSIVFLIRRNSQGQGVIKIIFNRNAHTLRVNFPTISFLIRWTNCRIANKEGKARTKHMGQVDKLTEIRERSRCCARASLANRQVFGSNLVRRVYE